MARNRQQAPKQTSKATKIVVGVIMVGFCTIIVALSVGSSKTTSGQITSSPIENSVESNIESVAESSEDISNDIIISEEPSEEESIVPHREGEEIVGVSDKKLDDINILFDDSVRNDVTGNWRLARIAEGNFDITEYAVDYYNKYFKSDSEVHAVINFTTNTTTRIRASTGMLFVSVLKYVSKEEHDAKLLFGGQKLSDYIIYLDNGDIEKID